MNDKFKTTLIALGTFILGGVLGSGFGLLVAPRSGKKTRKMIHRKGAKIKDRAVEGLEDTRDQAFESLDSLAEKTRDRAESVAERGKKLVARQKANVQVKPGDSR